MARHMLLSGQTIRDIGQLTKGAKRFLNFGVMRGDIVRDVSYAYPTRKQTYAAARHMMR